MIIWVKNPVIKREELYFSKEKQFYSAMRGPRVPITCQFSKQKVFLYLSYDATSYDPTLMLPLFTMQL